MTTLEELAARQADTTAEIRHIQTNLRKEPLPRRTKELYTSRLKTLDQLWDDFECTDNKIRAEYGEELAHSYFSSGYYETGLQSYQAIRSDILSRLDSLQRNKATTAAQQELATAKGLEAANSLPTESQHKGAVLNNRALRKTRTVAA